MGRKTKYNKEIESEICGLITEGVYSIKEICENVNIDKTTYFRWVENNATFATAIKRAESLGKLNGKTLAVKCIFGAMENGTWQAAAWWLERNFPSEFKNVQEHIQNYGIEDAREELRRSLEKNEPKRASNS